MITELIVLGQVLVIDLVLAGDNAIVVGMAAAGIRAEERGRVIFWGIACAVVVRILFAVMARSLLAIIGLTLAGGILLLWVCWKLFREVRARRRRTLRRAGAGAATPTASEATPAAPKSMRAAIWQVGLADVSMSLDNVLAIAGAAREHPWIMVVGLVLSVALMGVAATFVARLLERFFWIAYIGLVVITYVALEMLWRGGGEVWLHVT